MRIICLTFCFLFYIHVCFGQLVMTPSYLDVPSSYNPAIIGLFNDESVQMGLYSSTSKRTRPAIPSETDASSIFKSFRLLESAEAEKPSTAQAKNIYYLSFQKTIELKNKHRLSLGGQLQYRNDTSFKITTPQTIGFNVVFHKNTFLNKYKQRNISFGLQSNMIINKIDKITANLLYNLVVFEGSYENFLSHFKRFEQSHSINFNHSFVKYNRKLNNFSFSFRFDPISTYDIDRIFIAYRINSNHKTLIAPRISYNSQRILKSNKDLIEYNITLGVDNAFSLGYGRKLKSGNIFRLHGSLSGTPNQVDYGLKIGYQTSEYNYQIFTGINDYSSGSLVMEISAGYRITKSEMPSLFRLN